MACPDEPVQHGGHPQEPLAAVGLGDRDPAHRRGPVGALVQSPADLGPVGGKPRGRLFRGHAVGARGAAVGLDATQRCAQVGSREQRLPETVFLCAVGVVLGTRRSVAALCCGLRRAHRLLPLQARASRDGCDHCDSCEQHRLLRSMPDVRSFPARPHLVRPVL